MLLILAAAIVAASGMSLPKPVLAFALGVFLPIDVLGNVPSAALDVLRYSLAVTLIVRSIGHRNRRSSAFATVTLAALLTLSTIPILRSVFELDDPDTSSSLIAILSVLVAYSLATVRDLHGPIATGFVLGTAASAADIVFQAVGLPYLGTPATPPFNRFGGFSFSSTNAAPFLAIAIAIVVAAIASNKSHGTTSTPAVTSKKPILLLALQCAAVLLLSTGLILSGGRGGLAGLALALSLLALNRRYKYPLAILTISAAGFIVLSVKIEAIAGFLDRGGTSSGGFTTGRTTLNSDAWQAIVSAGFWGPSPTASAGLRPHTPVLTFGVTAGLVGVVIAAGLVLIVARVAISASSPKTQFTAYQLVAAVVLASSLLEPVGFFVGLTKTTILMIVLVGFKQPGPSPCSEGPQSRGKMRCTVKNEAGAHP